MSPLYEDYSSSGYKGSSLTLPPAVAEWLAASITSTIRSLFPGQAGFEVLVLDPAGKIAQFQAERVSVAQVVKTLAMQFFVAVLLPVNIDMVQVGLHAQATILAYHHRPTLLTELHR